MALEIKENNSLKMVIGNSSEIDELDTNTIPGFLGNIVRYVQERIEFALDCELEGLKDIPPKALTMMICSNIILNTITPRLKPENKDRRLYVMNRFLDEFKDITLNCFEEAEEISSKEKETSN
jgi:hypothetical protein